VDSRSDMPFAQLFPIGIIKPQLSDATFCSGGWLPDLGERWPSRLVATAAGGRGQVKRLAGIDLALQLEVHHDSLRYPP
jgi:hypothetical protein